MDYEIRAVTAGEDAQGRVLVRLRRSNDPDAQHGMATGHGLSTNIIEASLEAYVGALEKLLDVELAIDHPLIAKFFSSLVEWHKSGLYAYGGRAAKAERK